MSIPLPITTSVWGRTLIDGRGAWVATCATPEIAAEIAAALSAAMTAAPAAAGDSLVRRRRRSITACQEK